MRLASASGRDLGEQFVMHVASSRATLRACAASIRGSGAEGGRSITRLTGVLLGTRCGTGGGDGDGGSVMRRRIAMSCRGVEVRGRTVGSGKAGRVRAVGK